MKKFLVCFLMCGFALTVKAQMNTSGRVSSEAGEPLAGVSVQVKSGTTYAITDAKGEYKINAPEGSTLVFASLGYATKEVPATESIINVTLAESAVSLDELVVIGYGVQKKSMITAAIGSVKATDIEKETPTRIENALRGKVAGVTITQSSGQPGSGSSVRIRGIGTTGNSDPLYIIDGMQVGGGIDYLNPTDIASIEVLKDAASAAVYGTRGANGVILITTKSGAHGPAHVTYDFSYGWQNPWKKRALLNSEEYQVLMNEMNINDGKAPIYANPKEYKHNTDWQDEVFNYNAGVENHQVAVSGATDKTSYYLSFGYLEQDGIVGGDYGQSNYDRMSIRLNNTYKLFESKERDYLRSATLGMNTSYSHINSTGVGTNGVFGETLGNALMLSPLVPVYSDDPNATLAAQPDAVRDKNGKVYELPGVTYNEVVNPIAQMNLPASKNWSDKFVSTFFGELELYKGLKFKSSIGTDFAFWGNDGYSPIFYLGQSNKNDKSRVWSSSNRGLDWQLENTMSYTNTIAEKHNFTVLLGQSAREYTSRYVSGESYGLLSDDPDKANIDFTETPNGQRNAGGAAGNRYALVSYFGRLSYSFAERYMLEFTLRRDGSSRFGANNRFAVFPSVSLGWNVTNESFMESRPEWFNYLKVRGSWGKNGNDAIGDYRYTVTMNSGNNYIWGGQGLEAIVVGTKPNGISNPDIQWEATAQTDLGFDARFFNNALTFSFDYYKKVTEGMLIEVPIPTYVGDSKPIGNVGDMTNQGVELELGYRFKVLGDLSIGLSTNATYLKNTLDNLGNESGYANAESHNQVGTISRDENGYPYHFFYGLKTNGIFQTQNEVDAYVNKSGKKVQPNAVAGDVRFVDLNGDGEISDDDRTKIGNFFPKWTYGFTIDAEWKGIDLNAFFQGVAGSDIYDVTRRLDLTAVNLPGYMLDRWTGPGTSNSMPRLTFTDPNGNWKSSDLYIQNGAYLRLKSLQVGYTLPKNITKKVMIDKLRVYFMAENLLTFTGYRGFDPEMANGVDKGVYPQPRTISLGVNLGF
ncbi:MAG: TonB-dependent receptor [Prevotellaceae bacterium]|jgi:TonB-linked SusC/RagA family outer membrane protein|nr:TonB-dependent receptor [Prevotellaceae bacterium]